MRAWVETLIRPSKDPHLVRAGTAIYQADRTSHPQGVPDRPKPPAGIRKFLIVDDHPGFRLTLRSFLPAGTVTEEPDGRAALDAYAAEQPDWVLMDIEMPGMDGLTAARELRRRHPEARVIMVTGHPEEELRAAALAIGVWGFVLKDCLEDLPALIEAGENHDREP